MKWGRSVIATAAAALLLAGCAAKNVTTPIHRDGRVTVWLEHQLDDAGRPVEAGYRHPATLAPDDAGAVLRSLRVRRDPGVVERLLAPQRDAIEAAFSEDEIELLAPPIAQALAAATSADRVNFRFEHRRGLFRGGTTSGTLFMTEERLQVRLGRYRHAAPPDVNESRHRLDDPLDTRDTTPFKLVIGPFQESAADAPEALRERAIAVDYQGLLLATSTEGGGAPAGAPEAAEPGASGTDLEQRLRTLKRLHDQELISEEDYQAKKAELLREF